MTQVVRAFIDESSNGVFVMAGWVARAETWESFADAWQAELDQSPAIKYFKHYEAKQREGQFEGWEQAAIDDKTLALTRVICKHKPLYGISAGLIVGKLKEDIGRWLLPRKRLRSTGLPTEAYELCFLNTACRVIQVQLERNISDRVDFVFDDHALFEKCAVLYRTMREDIFSDEKKAIAGTVTSALDQDVPALQAADLLAGQMTTSIRFGKHDAPLALLQENIQIYISPTGLPRHMGHGELIEAMNFFWSAKQRLKEGKISVDEMKNSEDYIRFTNLVGSVLSVSREEMLRREADYRERVDANPKRRGPRRKITSSASPSLVEKPPA